METTSHNPQNPKNERTRFGEFFSNIFGGEILVKKKMRPWYVYFFFLAVLVTLLVISEQRIHVKQKKIVELENVYKAEISKLKANNQFIPYEKNKILIQKMQERGYITDEKHTFTVKETPKPVEKRRWFKRKERKHENK
ncbi:MAG: hypothetical protein K5901_07815 [Bacteroidales bacterium]|jgi:hypothetical protein|nr:hypothetical protein [Bacteroidales bacterium]